MNTFLLFVAILFGHSTLPAEEAIVQKCLALHGEVTSIRDIRLPIGEVSVPGREIVCFGPAPEEEGKEVSE